MHHSKSTRRDLKLLNHHPKSRRSCRQTHSLLVCQFLGMRTPGFWKPLLVYDSGNYTCRARTPIRDSVAGCIKPFKRQCRSFPSILTASTLLPLPFMDLTRARCGSSSSRRILAAHEAQMPIPIEPTRKAGRPLNGSRYCFESASNGKFACGAGFSP
jgi:hypothetical protein